MADLKQQLARATAEIQRLQTEEADAASQIASEQGFLRKFGTNAWAVSVADGPFRAQSFKFFSSSLRIDRTQGPCDPRAIFEGNHANQHQAR